MSELAIPQSRPVPWKLVGAVVLGAAMLVWIALRIVLLDGVTIPSSAMAPTIEAGDRVFLSTSASWERGTIVTFDSSGLTESGSELIKRIVGLPGEVISFRDGDVFVDGVRLEEPYLAEQGSTTGLPGRGDVFEVPERHVFMLGDDRRNSSDSRLFGFVSVEAIRSVQVSPWWWPFAR